MRNLLKADWNAPAFQFARQKASKVGVRGRILPGCTGSGEDATALPVRHPTMPCACRQAPTRHVGRKAKPPGTQRWRLCCSCHSSAKWVRHRSFRRKLLSDFLPNWAARQSVPIFYEERARPVARARMESRGGQQRYAHSVIRTKECVAQLRRGKSAPQRSCARFQATYRVQTINQGEANHANDDNNRHVYEHDKHTAPKWSASAIPAGNP